MDVDVDTWTCLDDDIPLDVETAAAAAVLVRGRNVPVPAAPRRQHARIRARVVAIVAAQAVVFGGRGGGGGVRSRGVGDDVSEKRGAPVGKLLVAKLAVRLLRASAALQLPSRHATRVNLLYGGWFDEKEKMRRWRERQY